MLKKFMTCFLTVILVLSLMLSAASADAVFTLRNGVQFGDTTDQVRAKETLEIASSSDTSLTTTAGTVAGIDGIKIFYYFDENGKLTEIQWELPSSTYSEISDNNYNKLYNALKQKYGSPLGYSNGDCFIITGKALNNVTMSYSFYKMVGWYGVLRDYDEWDFKFGDDDHVKIEIGQSACGETYQKAQYYIYVGYKYFTDADLQNAIEEKQQDNQTIMDDI